ncbi:monolysocardiolipin acyltransferase [Microdochium nivale]|nr:monolysocardiolipin acyltransferase [Microdochium nivale]
MPVSPCHNSPFPRVSNMASNSNHQKMVPASPRLQLGQQERPSLAARFASAATITLVTSLCRAFLYGLNTVEVTGLDRFLAILDEREDPAQRQRGLITVSNHISSLDDPLIWGVLPLKYALNPANSRWGLGAHDICFKNRPLEWFFAAGQVLPAHRVHHSQNGGLFQPTMVQAIRLLSSQPFKTQPELSPPVTTDANTYSSFSSPPPPPSQISDPFTDGGLTFTSNGYDTFDAPSRYSRNRHSWVHIFPEAMIHQQPQLHMRYFKWGVSRLILESEPMPDVLPIFIDGTQRVMAEDRGFPRFLPRAGVTVRVAFGEPVDMEDRFGDLRSEWRDLVRRKHVADGDSSGGKVLVMGELTDELKYGAEAVALRIEVARRVRNEVAKLRKTMGHPDEKPGLDLAETWALEPAKKHIKSEVDDSLEGKGR